MTPNNQQWHIAGPGAIGLLYHYKVSELSNFCHSQTPYLINRSLNNSFEKYTFINLQQEAQQIPAKWFKGQHIIHKLVVTTKSHQVIQCLESLTPYLANHCQIILLHNGLGVQQQVTARWPEFDVFFGSSTEGVWKSSDNTVHHAGNGITTFGREHPQKPEWWGEEISKLPNSQWSPDILSQLHNKVAVNASINPLTILFECKNGELLSNEDRLQLLDQLSEESRLVLKSEGYDIPSMKYIVRDIARKTGQNYSSSYQDWKHKRTTELSNMNGYIMNLAKKHGLSTPTHDKVMNDVATKASI
ncbi:2-dehydropantoate 2-reductase [Litoribacillus peritrichatus]|uniref:2-dehydropantoate 2-reductase n=1 Tax=Litoribacillus peritrichatus TaxID=718191 RepID=A0ABP7MW77_9GAMM